MISEGCTILKKENAAKNNMTDCIFVQNGSEMYSDLHFLGCAGDFVFPVLAAKEKDWTVLLCADTNRIHRIELKNDEIEIAAGNYNLRLVGAEGIILTPSLKCINIKESFEYLYNYNYHKRLKAPINVIKTDSSWFGGSYYSEHVPFILRLGIGIRLDFLDPLRGREWDVMYDDDTKPVLFVSGNRAAVIKPLSMGGAIT
jgi:hypothetical protein